MRPKGFTLVELLVVIAIIGLLSTVAVLNANSSRLKARIAAGLQSDNSIYHARGDEIIADWGLDAASGTAISDNSGNGYGGTLAGTITGSTYAAGVVGGAIYFDGSTNYIQPPKQITIYLNSFTATAWFKTTSPNDQKIISAGESFGHPIIIVNGNVCYQMGISICGSRKYNDDQWHFVAITGDATSRRVYVDNVLQGSGTASSSSVTASMAIGADASPHILFFNGTLDQVRLYGASMTARSIQKAYALGRITHQ